MKVILTQNVAGYGQKDDIKEAKPGYWRNFLMPNKLAILATDNLIKGAEARKKAVEERKVSDLKKLTAAIKKLEGKLLTVEMKADEKGNLFEGLSAEKISDLISGQFKIDVPAEEIGIEKPVKKTGVHKIPIGEAVLEMEVRELKAD
jgi:large subunit ribosomal protein L9